MSLEFPINFFSLKKILWHYLILSDFELSASDICQWMVQIYICPSTSGKTVMLLVKHNHNHLHQAVHPDLKVQHASVRPSMTELNHNY